jgi:hypothetical protein
MEVGAMLLLKICAIIILMLPSGEKLKMAIIKKSLELSLITL